MAKTVPTCGWCSEKIYARDTVGWIDEEKIWAHFECAKEANSWLKVQKIIAKKI